MDQQTVPHPAELACGRGLAANASLPASLAELMTTMADVLEAHTRALDPGEPPAYRELQAYRAIIVEQRTAAARLDAVATLMHAEHDLPAAPHDPEALSSRAAADALERFRASATRVRALIGKAESLGR